jgi:hypothetical protein
MSGYVVSRPFEGSGVGSNLASLAGALWIADRLGRTLLIDWRAHSDLNDKRLNYFDEFLTLPERINGVEIRPVPAGDSPFAPEEAVQWLQPGDGRALATGTRRAEKEYLALRIYHGLDRVHPGPEAERFRLLRAFYHHLQPKPAVTAAIDEWTESTLRRFGFVVGVNVRTGNGSTRFRSGGAYDGRFDVQLLEEERRFLALLERACARVARRFPRSLRSEVGIFYATDSTAMSSLLSRLPNSVTRRAVFPPPGVDHEYAFSGTDYTDRDGVIDTLTDMFLLARCDGLVYNGSLFSQYARVLSGWYSGNCVHFESMLLKKRARAAVVSVRSRVR